MVCRHLPSSPYHTRISPAIERRKSAICRRLGRARASVAAVRFQHGRIIAITVPDRRVNFLQSNDPSRQTDAEPCPFSPSMATPE
jgi:hypothetical protein